MKTHVLSSFVLALAIATAPLAGQPAASAPASASRQADQSYVLDTTPKDVAIPAFLVDSTQTAPNHTLPPINLSQAQVEQALTAALTPYNEKLMPGEYYILHLVQHLEGKPASIRDAWYVYTCNWKEANATACHALSGLDKLNIPHWAEQYRRGRLFGTRRLNLVYLHYNVPVTDGVVNNGFLPIRYTIDITKKTPIVLDNLRLVGGAFGLMGEPGYRALVGIKLGMRIDYVTSNIAIAGQRGTDRSNIGSKEFDNERRYPLDFGFAIPLSKIKELKFGDGNTLVARPVEKSNIYGIVSVFPFGAVDTKAEKAWFRAPQLMYGMSLSSKPWDNHLFALGFLTKYVQPFVGMSLVNKQVRTPTDGDPGLKWSARIAYGVHIPASTLATFVKSAGR